MSIVDVTDQNFEGEVLKSGTPVVVDVWATWCGPCRLYSPVIEEVSKDYEGKVKFVKVDADENQKVVERYNVMSQASELCCEEDLEC